MAEVIVIGGGAAGMVAAIAAATCGDTVTILERMDRVGKKLLATGNGRCNLMNTNAWDPSWHGSDLAIPVLEYYGAAKQTEFWRQLGLVLREEDGGRVYPASNQASTVLDVLRLSLERLRVKICTQTTVMSIKKVADKFNIHTDVGMLNADRVIVTGGGCAQPKLGSNGSCYALLQAFGHSITPVRPALTQIETDTAPIKGLSGIRVKCGVAVIDTYGQTVHEEQGEALFADYGVSGVCVMQCAAYAQSGYTLRLQLAYGLGMDGTQIRSILQTRKKQWATMELEQLLTGLFVPRLSMAIGKMAGVAYQGRLIGSLQPQEIDRITKAIIAFDVTIKGIKGFDTAQVTAGGIKTTCFDPYTLASRLVSGLQAAGEVLDVDGTCGGYNLMFAFGSGILAGLNGRENPFGGT